MAAATRPRRGGGLSRALHLRGGEPHRPAHGIYRLSPAGRRSRRTRSRPPARPDAGTGSTLPPVNRLEGNVIRSRDGTISPSPRGRGGGERRRPCAIRLHHAPDETASATGSGGTRRARRHVLQADRVPTTSSANTSGIARRILPRRVRRSWRSGTGSRELTASSTTDAEPLPRQRDHRERDRGRPYSSGRTRSPKT